VKDTHKALQDVAKEHRRNAEMSARAVRESQEELQRVIKEAAKAAMRVLESKTPQQTSLGMPAEMAEAQCLD